MQNAAGQYNPSLSNVAAREQSRLMDQIDEARAIHGRVASLKESLDALVGKVSGGGALTGASNKTNAPSPTGLINDLSIAHANTNEQLTEIDQILNNLRNYI